MSFSIRRSRLTKISSMAGLTSQAIAPSIAETQSASTDPRRSHPQYGRR